jgi:hypothetical protein
MHIEYPSNKRARHEISNVETSEDEEIQEVNKIHSFIDYSYLIISDRTTNTIEIKTR